MPRRLRLLATVPALALVLSACGAGSLSPRDVATAAEKALEEQLGVRTRVQCPGELSAEPGAILRCALTADGDLAEYGVTVTVTSERDGTAEFDVQVDDRPTG